LNQKSILAKYLLAMKAKEPIEEFIKFNFPSQSEVYCGDALSYLKRFPARKFDLIITSPPHNAGKSYETKQSK
jgi:DNA modification methylase